MMTLEDYANDVGKTLEEVYEHSVKLNRNNIKQLVSIIIIFIFLFGFIFTVMIKILDKQAKEFRGKLLKQSELMEDIYKSMSAGLLRVRMTDDQTTIIKINPKGLELLGVTTEEELNDRIKNQILDTIDKEDGEKLVFECKKLKEQWESVVVECHVKWKDGSVRLLRILNTLVDFEEEAKIIQRMCQDITEERKKQEKVLKEAEEKVTLDPMTKIKNKKAIEEIIRAKIKEAGEQDLSIAIGFVDIDNFRDYNTKYGHMQGDEVIKYVASVLKNTINGIVGRTGGDEFAFGILDASFDEVENTMKMVHKKLNEGVFVKQENKKIPTPCSIGVVIEKDKNLAYDLVMEDSDKAMYYAKESGKNTYYILVKSDKN